MKIFFLPKEPCVKNTTRLTISSSYEFRQNLSLTCRFQNSEQDTIWIKSHFKDKKCLLYEDTYVHNISTFLLIFRIFTEKLQEITMNVFFRELNRNVNIFNVHCIWLPMVFYNYFQCLQPSIETEIFFHECNTKEWLRISNSNICFPRKNVRVNNSLFL